MLQKYFVHVGGFSNLTIQNRLPSVILKLIISFKEREGADLEYELSFLAA